MAQRVASNGRGPQPGERMAWFLGRGNVATDRESFFVWQERVLDLLLAWGVGNVAAGSALAIAGSGLTQAIGVQAVVWGAIDSAVALYAQCVARRHAVSARAGEMGAQTVQDQAERFEYLLALTTGADVLYVMAGSLVAWKSKNLWLKGSALGVIIQGSALLIYDLGLTIRMITRPETHFRAPGYATSYA
jgi:hypothetical protein